MKAIIILFIAIIAVHCEYTQKEKDKYLACGELVKMQKEKDKAELASIMKQEDFLRKGIDQILSLDMLSSCIEKIDEKTIEKIFINGEYISTSIEDIDCSFFKIDYAPYGKMHEFFFDGPHRELLSKMNSISKEYSDKQKAAKKSNKEEEVSEL